MTDAISIEETNRIRAAIGLKPLPVPGKPNDAGLQFKDAKSTVQGQDEDDPGSTLESRQGAAYDNWKKLQDEAASKATREAKNEAVKKARDAARRFAKLEGKGLGEADDGEDVDARTWLLQQKKRQKKIEKARRLEQELAEREQAAEYTAKDLAGVKVAHEVDAFDDGGEQVLVLKDATIDENEDEGDELESINLREREKLTERLELKKKTRVYDPNADDGNGEQSILGQYDEEIDGKKRKTFTLAGLGLTSDEKDGIKVQAREKLNVAHISLDIAAPEPISDYLNASEVKIRKPKKKKTKSTKQRTIDDDDMFAVPVAEEPATETTEQAMEVDQPVRQATNGAQKRAFEETSLVDDEDLQAALAMQRRNALKKRKRVGPAELARQIREEGSATPAAEATNDDEMNTEEEPGLVIDETSEFVANIQKPTAPAPARPRPVNADPTTSMVDSPSAKHEDDQDSDVEMSDGDDDKVKNEDRQSSIPAETSTGLDNEITLDAGIGSTLKMLTQRGLLKPSSTGDLNALHRERQRFLAEKQRRETEAERRARLQRERDRASGRLDRMSAREKEAYAQAENKQRDQFESRQMAEIFNREYKPDIEITYTDEFGRHMNQKEAFKHLSHQFHGKGSGKQKTEKRLKKLAEEKKQLAQSALGAAGGGETTTGSAAITGLNKMSKTPGIRLQ